MQNFHACCLTLATDPSLEALPTDERLRRAAAQPDPGLDALYFQYGRWLLFAASRPGSLPANLQGVWNDSFFPPWDSKYTININTEMNYWPANICGLAQSEEPLFDLLARMVPNGQRTARELYHCRGFVAHHNTDLWGDTDPQDRYIPASFWPMGAAWLCTHIWRHYLYSGDMQFLRAQFPMLEQAVLFFTDFLEQDAAGYYVTNPSVSPENTYILPDGVRGHLCIGPTMDRQILRELFAGYLPQRPSFPSRMRRPAPRLPSCPDCARRRSAATDAYSNGAASTARPNPATAISATCMVWLRAMRSAPLLRRNLPPQRAKHWNTALPTAVATQVGAARGSRCFGRGWGRGARSKKTCAPSTPTLPSRI